MTSASNSRRVSYPSFVRRIISFLFARSAASEHIRGDQRKKFANDSHIQDEEWNRIAEEVAQESVRELEKGNREVHEFYERTAHIG